MLPRDDVPLHQRLRDGELGAFEELLRTYGARMLGVARRMLRSEDDARDCLQESMILAFRKIGQFEDRAALGTWLHRITVNCALMQLRRATRLAEEPIDEHQPEFGDDDLREPEPRASILDESAETLLERSQVAAAVRRAIDALPEIYRTVLLLRDIEELDTEETARCLDTNTRVVKTRLHRARAALKRILEADPGVRPR